MWGILTMLTNGSVPAGERIRIALPGIPTLRTITAENKTRTALALYLHERLNESDSVELVNGARANYLFSTLRRDIGTAASDQYFAAFNRYLPVDAIVTYRVVVGTLQVTVYTHRGRKEHTFPSATGAGMASAIVLTATSVGKDIGLNDEATAVLREKRFASNRGFNVFYVGSCLNSAWPNNSGETKLRYINPIRNEYRNHVKMQGLVLRSAAELLRSRNRSQDYAKSAQRMAWSSLQVVLGTPEEASACKFAALSSETVEKDLLEITAPLLGGDDLDELAEIEEDEEDTDGLAGAGEKKEVSMAVRLSALRVLAHCISNNIFGASLNQSALNSQ